MSRHAIRICWLLTAAAALLVGAAPVVAHGPTPYSTSESWRQGQRLEYRWRAGEVPPAWMQSAVRAGADDSNDSRASKAAVIAYASDGPSWVAYDEAIGCGAAAIACTTRSMPESFSVELRRHGTVYDWGVLRWCQAYDAPPDGCFDAENLALHEFGHVQTLTHHDNHADGSDYRDSVVQQVSRSKPRSGWNDHVFGRCDVASLQRRYDVLTSSTLYSTCRSLDTTLQLSPSASYVTYRAGVTFTATLRVSSVDGYGRLAGNLVSHRRVVLQRRPLGGTTWTSVATMSAGSGGGTYSVGLVLTTSADWRAVFPEPADEGLDGSASSALTVRVSTCTGMCPSEEDGDAI